MTSLKSRVLVAVVCIPLLLWVVLWSPLWVVRWALAVLSMIAAGELLMCVGLSSKEKPVNVLTVLDPETLEIERTIELPVQIFGITYNEKKDIYAAGLSFGKSFCLELLSFVCHICEILFKTEFI